MAQVEKTLNDLRERVRVQMSLQSSAQQPGAQSVDDNPAAIESLQANLSVLQRSWSRLPPISSYRSGWTSRLELWVKRLIKRLSHWFTWEQVNFNSATANSFEEVLNVLRSHEQYLRSLQERLDAVSPIITEIGSERTTPGQPSKSSHQAEPRKRETVIEAEYSEARITDERVLIASQIDSLVSRIEELRTMKERRDRLT